MPPQRSQNSPSFPTPNGTVISNFTIFPNFTIPSFTILPHFTIPFPPVSWPPTRKSSLTQKTKSQSIFAPQSFNFPRQQQIQRVSLYLASPSRAVHRGGSSGVTWPGIFKGARKEQFLPPEIENMRTELSQNCLLFFLVGVTLLHPTPPYPPLV